MDSTISSGTSPSRQTYRQILAQIAATAQKSNSGAPAYARWLNRPLGRRVAAFAAMRGITPNQLTAANAALIFPVLLLLPLFRPTLAWNASAALILLIGYVLDSADGQLARFRGGGTKLGEWIDHAADGLKTSLLHAVVLIIWFRFYAFETSIWLLVPVAFGVIATSYFFSLMLADDLRRLARVERGEPGFRSAHIERSRPIRSLILLPNEWGVICGSLVLLPFQWPFVAMYSFLLLANTAFIIAGTIRWCRELATLN